MTSPFSNGTQAMDWKCRNCFQCAKEYDEAKGKWNCDIEKAVDSGFIGEWSDDSMLPRMGYVDDMYTWDCKEIVRL